jgi:hypothetical protein
LVAEERNATNCPVSEAAGAPDGPLLGFFCDPLEMRVVDAARAVVLLRMRSIAITAALLVMVAFS